MILNCDYSCFNKQVRIYILQLQKWHQSATDPVSTNKWGSTSKSYRNDTDLLVILFQHTSEDLHLTVAEMTLINHSSCFYIQVRIYILQLQLLILFQHTSEDSHLTVVEMTLINHSSCFNIQVRIYFLQLQLLILFHHTSEDRHYTAAEWCW